MSIKNLIRMAILLCVLIAASLIIPKIVYRTSSTTVFSSIPQDQWKKIVITKLQGEIILTRTEGTWMVSQSSSVYHADAHATRTLLDALEKLVLGDIISKNSNRHEVFQVTPLIGTRIQLFSNDPVNPDADFYLGKSMPDYTSYYLRYEGENTVYHSSGLSSYVVNKPFEQWRNRALGVTNRELIDAVEFVKDQVVSAVVLEGDAWKYEGREVDQKYIDSLLHQITTIHAVELVKPQDEEEVKKSLGNVTAELTISTLGEKNTITLYPTGQTLDGQADVEKYYAVKEDEQGIFITNKNIYDLIATSFTTIKQSFENPPQEAAAEK